MSLDDPDLSRRLLSAAAHLIGDGQADADAMALLSALEYLAEGDTPTPAAGLAQHRAALLRAASKLNRLFQLGSPDAPGAVFFGGEIGPPGQAGSVSGVGLSVRSAFESCVGEAVEFRSQLEERHHRLDQALAASSTMTPGHREWLSSVLARQRPGVGAPDWIAAQRFADGSTVMLPADVCVRRTSDRRSIDPPYPLSIGCAAGPSREAATLRALLELIERDAVSLWWQGGKFGRLLSLEDPAIIVAAELVRHLRQGRSNRQTWLLDITSDLGVPSVAAVSCTEDGTGFACGVAARPAMADAAHSAILELCQMELAHGIVTTKRSYRGDDALNDIDRRHLRRAIDLNALTCPLLHPVPRAAAVLDFRGPADVLALIVDRLASLNVEVLVLDLTHPDLGVPVVRVLAPGLQLEPSTLQTTRLREAISAAGGGKRYTNGIELM